MYRILFPHASSNPSPCECLCLTIRVHPATKLYQDYHSDDERPKDTTSASGLLGEPFPWIEQIKSLIEHLYNTLPEKVSTRWQGQPKSGGLPTLAEALNATANTGRQCSQAQSGPLTGAELNSSQPLASIQELKTLISEGVLETCAEWLRNCRELDDTDHEESADDSEHNHFTSGLANSQSLSLAPITTLPDQWSWYPEDRISSDYKDYSTPPSKLPQPQPPKLPSFSQPKSGLPMYYGVPSLSEFDSNLYNASAPSYNFSYRHLSPGIQFSETPWQPDMAPSNNLEGSGGLDYFRTHNLSASHWEAGGQTHATEIATTFPESYQDP